MPRNRVLSFISRSKDNTPSATPTNGSPPLDSKAVNDPKGPFPSLNHPNLHNFQSRPITPPSGPDYGSSPSSPVQSSQLNRNGSPPNSDSGSPTRGHQHKRTNSRPLSIYGGYQAPIMDVDDQTPPELQPIFSFLNSHSNKLYQEGYFLKLDDQNTQGKPNPDRTWTECFAQLVGTVLSLWDAAELDAAGEDGEVLPKFINLTDASIKMIDSLPTRSGEEQPLQNILSISTAGRNRYLLHFNSHHSLVQWTAGIRLAMYEHNTLQEAYTGALIAGKGKTLNNINVILERARFPTQEWVRVRFGAGVPWRRCWCVITPPDEKEYAKLQKEMKKKNPYDRSPVPNLKGDIKFYDQRKGDVKKQKKLQPIATITDAHAAYAIYPQAKSLVDASTLLKIEGDVTVHSDPPSSTEGFVFIMPEVRPAVVGFEMLLRFLFPTWDTFGLYGRPGRLVASTLDSRSLMFAMPKNSRYGYLELLDVTNLTTEAGSAGWSERDWRKKLKDATGTRMNAMDDYTASRSHSRSDSRRSARLSYGGGGQSGPPKAKVGFAEPAKNRASRSFSLGGPARSEALPTDNSRALQPPSGPQHMRNNSDPNNMGSAPQPSYLQPGADSPYSNNSPAEGQSPMRGVLQERVANSNPDTRTSSEEDISPPNQNFEAIGRMQTPEPVQRPPAFNHTSSGGVPQKNKAYHSPALRRANSRLSSTTLAQLAKAGGVALPADGSVENTRQAEDARNGQPVRPPHGNPGGAPADNRSREAMSPPGPGQNQGQPGAGPAYPAPLSIPTQNSRGPNSPGMGPPSPYNRGPNSPAFPPREGSRSPYPPGQGPPPPQHGQQMPYRPAPGSRPGTSASERGGPGPMGRPELARRPTMEQENSLDADDILDSYGGDPGPAHQHQHRGPQGPPERNPDRPRAGVQKTVAGGEEPIRNPNIPDINFGPTINYGAQQRRPVPGGGPAPPQGQRPYSPAPGGQRGPEGPQRPPMAPAHSSEKRNMPWHPAGMAPSHAQHGMSPEEYVQQRAAAAPQYGHARSPSGDAMANAQAGRPAHGRRRSSFSMLDEGAAGRPQYQGHRPSSSGNSQGGSSQMSARDREQVARMTGQPLINNVQGQRPQTAGDGLVGSIDYRERERQQMRQGANQQAAMAAQQAMQQRQQQQSAMHHQVMAQQYQNQQRTGSPAYGTPGSFSRPMGGSPSPRPDQARFPPQQGQYAGQQGPQSNMHPQYQGQAF